MNRAEYDLMFRMEERHWYFRGKRRIVGELLRPYLRGGPLTVLDAGCGTGGTLAMLEKIGRVFAIDPFPEAAAYCAQRGFPRIAQASVTALPFPSSCFDVITSLDVIEHVGDDRAALGELCRVLKPGGVLMLTVPACMSLWSGHDVALHHKRRYSAAELRGKVMGSGFRVARLTSFNSILFPLVAAVRIARRRLGLDRASSDSDRLPASAVNELLYLVLETEARLLRSLDFPAGVSLACVAVKET